MQRIRRLFAAASEQFDAMSTRDRWLAVALVFLVAGAVVGAITWAVFNALEDQASRVRAAKENYLEAQELADRYTVLRGKLDVAEAQVAQFRASQINTYISKWAAEAGLSTNLKGIREGGSRSVGAFTERSYRVEIDQAELEGITKFLYALESSTNPMRVRSATFKVQSRRDARPLDLDLEIVAFTQEEG